MNESRWGRHPIFDGLGSPQLHERQAVWRGSKSLSIEPQSFREQDLLKALFVVQAEFHPEPRGVHQEMLRECECAFDIKVALGRGTQFHLCEGDLPTQLVALAFIGLPVDRSFVKEGLIDPIETLSLLGDRCLQTGSETSGVALSPVPCIEHNGVEQAHVARLRL